MEVLPTNDLHYAEYLQTFTNMAAALKAVQRSDGFWNVNLGYTNDYPGPESSGTACFTYGLAWGINHGYLDTNTYLPAVINGWNALAVGALHHSTGADNGFLGYVQCTGSKPSDGQPVTYTSVPDFDDFGLGLFLLAGSQIYQLSSPPGIVLATPVIDRKTGATQLYRHQQSHQCHAQSAPDGSIGDELDHEYNRHAYDQCRRHFVSFHGHEQCGRPVLSN